MFVKPQIRRSLISKMLTEILDTRVMVKKSMKLIDADDVASNPCSSIAHHVIWLILRFIGTLEDPECEATRPEVHRQRHVWVHVCNFFRSHAVRRDCRCYRPNGSRDAGKSTFAR